MAYYTKLELEEIGFKYLGKNIKVSTKAIIYDAELISIGDFSRIDDLCILSGKIEIGAYCHITPMCLVAGGKPGIKLSDFCTLAYGVKIFAQSDDYTGESMVNSLISADFKKEHFAAVHLDKHTIIGTNSVIFPGVTVGEGTSIGAMSLVLKSTKPWGIYVGTPAKRIKDRNKNILKLESQFLYEKNNDTI
ncbi:acyltransferase [Shewanella japonica]|uniref:Acetyltransferase n=1 Tax=Shewanella japonica TaxID=93973 RepID=A0ABN4YL77_9GAMM|nr:acyltransferase [Shewanella japonica]ARD21657.1 Acetyltransferase [Shewanella japonica]